MKHQVLLAMACDGTLLAGEGEGAYWGRMARPSAAKFKTQVSSGDLDPVPHLAFIIYRWPMPTQLLPSVLNIFPMSLWSLSKKKKSSMETTDGEQGAVTTSLAASASDQELERTSKPYKTCHWAEILSNKLIIVQFSRSILQKANIILRFYTSRRTRLSSTLDQDTYLSQFN